MVPSTPLRRPRTYFERRRFPLGPALAAVGVSVLSMVVALLGFGYLLASRLGDAGHADAVPAVWDAVMGNLLGVILALLLGWLFVTVVLHLLASAVIAGDGSIGETLVVSGWGTVPTVASSLVTFGLLASALGSTNVTTPDAFLAEFQANVASTSPLGHAVSFAVAGWQTYVYGNGLAVEFDADTASGYLVGGVVAFGGWLLGLL